MIFSLVKLRSECYAPFHANMQSSEFLLSRSILAMKKDLYVAYFDASNAGWTIPRQQTQLEVFIVARETCNFLLYDRLMV